MGKLSGDDAVETIMAVTNMVLLAQQYCQTVVALAICAPASVSGRAPSSATQHSSLSRQLGRKY